MSPTGLYIGSGRSLWGSELDRRPRAAGRREVLRLVARAAERRGPSIRPGPRPGPHEGSAARVFTSQNQNETNSWRMFASSP